MVSGIFDTMNFSCELSGSLGEKVDHMTYEICGKFLRGQNKTHVCGVDLHANMTTVYNITEYSTYLYAMKAEEAIKNHNPRKVNSKRTVW